MAGSSENFDEIFDKADLLERLEGDFELARQMGEMFIDDSHETLEVIRDLLGKNDAGGVSRAAHSIKGASSNLSAFRLSRISAELESAAEQNSLSRAAELFALMETELENFVCELKRQVLD
ncbi:MAG: Hpt domain-containing protein [Desulfobacterales bacterium]